ncbi:hypothetical protein [Methyloglobulus sp.]|uniref:hypothetical protein n=1 Tax=Methyloglobulus sp. TaxID=2518622 RepID=UPI0039892CB0
MTIKSRLVKLEAIQAAKPIQTFELSEAARQWLDGVIRHYNESAPKPPSTKSNKPITQAAQSARAWLENKLLDKRV